MNVEQHPFEPFMPKGARLLMLGTFPPAEKRWDMPFFYPNLQNDMWRIAGLCFFNDKHFFLTPDHRHYREEHLKDFLTSQGIALYDTCTAVIRTTGTARDKDLQVVEETDLAQLLENLPLCRAIVTAGQLATTIACRQLATEEPSTDNFSNVSIGGRSLRIYRMPSSSRAYPMSVEHKAEQYKKVFDYVFNL